MPFVPDNQVQGTQGASSFVPDAPQSGWDKLVNKLPPGIKQVAGIYGAGVKTAGAVGNALISSEKGFAKSITSAFGPEKGASQAMVQAQVADSAKLRETAYKLPLNDPRRLQLLRDADAQEKGAQNSEYQRVGALPNAKQVAAQAAGVGLDVLSFGTYGAAAKGAQSFKLLRALPSVVQPFAKQAVTKTLQETSKFGFKQGFVRGAKPAAKFGALWGSTQGGARALQADASLEEAAWAAVKGGAIGGAAGGLIGGTVGGFQARSAQRAAQAKLIEMGAADDTLAGKTLDAQGRLVSEKGLAQTSKIHPGKTRIMQDMTPEEKVLAKKMLDVRDKASHNEMFSTKPEGRSEYIVGGAVDDEITFLKNQRKIVGSQIGEAAKKMGKKPVDITKVADQFYDDLDNAGVKIGDGGRLDFTRSEFAKLPSAQKHLQGIVDDLVSDKTGKVMRTPIDILREKRAVGMLIRDLTKTGTPLPTNIRRIIANVGDHLDDPLAAVSPQYAALADKYSTINGGLNDFLKFAGKEFADGDEFATLRYGELSNRIFGNASAKPSMIFVELDDAARAVGYKGKVDIVRLSKFNEFLDDMYGPTQTRGFQGEITKGINEAGEAVQEQVAKSVPGGKYIQSGIRLGKRLLKGDPSEAVKAEVRAYLSSAGDDISGAGGGVAGNPSARLAASADDLSDDIPRASGRIDGPVAHLKTPERNLSGYRIGDKKIYVLPRSKAGVHGGFMIDGSDEVFDSVASAKSWAKSVSSTPVARLKTNLPPIQTSKHFPDGFFKGGSDTIRRNVIESATKTGQFDTNMLMDFNRAVNMGDRNTAQTLLDLMTRYMKQQGIIDGSGKIIK